MFTKGGNRQNLKVEYLLRAIGNSNTMLMVALWRAIQASVGIAEVV